MPRAFRSDNNAGLCPEALEALAAGNDHHHTGYGDDPHTDEAVALLRRLFSPDAHAFFVPTGTIANTLAVACLARPWSRVLCHEHAHWNDDESTAPEAFTGCRTSAIGPPGAVAEVIPATSKLTAADVRRAAAAVGRGDVHQPAPGALTISNPTEFGEVYTPDEVRALAAAAHEAGYAVHMDGARFANAVASLLGPGAPPDRAADLCRALTIDAGIDALSFGGTKNGLALGEAVLFFPQRAAPRGAALAAGAAEDFPFRRKRAGALISKHRVITAPFAATLRDGAWLRHAAHANELAAHLSRGLRDLGFDVPFRTDSNGVFVRLTEREEARLRERGHGFYMFGHPAWRLARLMCSFDSARADVEALLTDARAARPNT
ncbi:MAG: threonine aldolase [Phycisphaerales bacterium]|nr:threonine aldolase [Phycisphaerales bacterium]